MTRKRHRRAPESDLTLCGLPIASVPLDTEVMWPKPDEAVTCMRCQHIMNQEHRERMKTMHRRNGHQTSRDAAERVSRKLTELQKAVLEEFRAHGTLTDGELLALPRFDGMAESTARKRRTELYQRGLVEIATDDEGNNLRRDNRYVWRLVHS